MLPGADAWRPVLLAGPTAGGKSDLALRIAERDGGCVVNADAAQVYRCWRVLTARPSDDDLARAPHRLYGHVSCATRHSVGDWLRAAAPALEAARRDGLRPIVVGGTGLYFGALTAGLAVIPEIPAEVRARSEAMLADGGIDALLADLGARDPAVLDRIDRRNPVRVQRAWEVHVTTGQGIAWWQARSGAPLVDAGAVRIVLDPDNALLHQRIEARIDRMIEAGALDECRRFLRAGVDPVLPAAKVIGARPMTAALRGEITLDEARRATATATRQFAKRQRTWFRSRMADWQRLDPAAGDPLDAVP